MKNNFFKISNRRIGPDFEPLVIAEIGINHDGSIEKAIKIVDSAINNGAEVIKHQTHVVEDEMSEEAKKIIPANSNLPIFEIIKNAALNAEDEYKLMNYIKSKKKIFISTPFSRKAVDRLEKFKVPAFKIGSGECNNYLLIEYIAKKRKPIILSTGMNSIKDVKPSVKIFRKYKIPFALLHCTNIYPTPPNLVRLGAIKKLQKYFPDAIIGLSDHTETIYTSLAAIALNASIVEKHFIDSKNRKGPDVTASMDPGELKSLINGSKIIFSAKGDHKGPVKEERQTIKFAFASAVATKNILKGEKFTLDNFFLIRPGNGDFNIRNYKNLFKRRARKKILKMTQIKKQDTIF